MAKKWLDSHEAFVSTAQELAAIAGKAACSNRAVTSDGADAAAGRRIEQSDDAMVSWWESIWQGEVSAKERTHHRGKTPGSARALPAGETEIE